MSKVFKQIYPTTGSGTYTFQNNRRITFQIAGEGKAIFSEMRLNGYCNITTDVARATALVSGNDVNINQWAGLHSIISRLKIRSLKYSSKIAEEIMDYPRLAATINAMLHSKADFDTERCHEDYARGYGQPTDMDLPEISTLAADPVFNSSSLRQTRRHLVGNKSFSMRLIAGMLQSNMIDLTELGGMEIEIELNSDSDVFFGAGAANAGYNLTNLSLSLPVVMDGSTPSPNPEFDFLSFKSTRKAMTSTTTSLNDGNLTLGNVLGVIQNFSIQGYENNTLRDGQALYNPGIKTLEYRLNGRRFPLNNVINTNYDDTRPLLHQLTTNAEVIRNAYSALKKYVGVERTSLDGNLVRGYANSLEQGCFVMGCAFDQVSGMGVEFQNANFSTVSEQSTDNPTADGAVPVASVNYRMFSHYLIRQTVSIMNNQLEVEV